MSIKQLLVTAPVIFIWPFVFSQPPPCTPGAYSQRLHQVKHFYMDSKSSLMIWFNPGGKGSISESPPSLLFLITRVLMSTEQQRIRGHII